MWNPAGSLYTEVQLQLAGSVPRGELTVKDLLLSGSSGDMVSPPNPTLGVCLCWRRAGLRWCVI